MWWKLNENQNQNQNENDNLNDNLNLNENDNENEKEHGLHGFSRMGEGGKGDNWKEVWALAHTFFCLAALELCSLATGGTQEIAERAAHEW